MNQVPRNATVAAIRSEHLATDWNSMEEHLGSPASARVKSFPRQNPADQAARSGRVLVEEARDHLCRYLCNEIQVYKHILYRAVNLKESDVDESMAELRKSCPREADLPACPL
jgi:hypothetical protein